MKKHIMARLRLDTPGRPLYYPHTDDPWARPEAGPEVLLPNH